MSKGTFPALFALQVCPRGLESGAAAGDIYTMACLLASPRNAATGEYSVLSGMTDLTIFVTALAGHIAAEAATLERFARATGTRLRSTSSRKSRSLCVVMAAQSHDSRA
jgi:hypothetical protein